MYTQVTINYEGHIILFEGGEHNKIIEHLNNISIIALSAIIVVEIPSLNARKEFTSKYSAIEFIEKEYYNNRFKEEK